MQSQIGSVLRALFIIAGWVLAAYAFVMPATPPGAEVLNLGLLVDKIILALIGTSMAISGSVSGRA